MNLFRIFGFSVTATIAGLAFVLLDMGFTALLIAAILILVEISFSFDNAVINAKVLAGMSPFWQKIFLTIGILIAIFGMRAFFPIAIVSVTADLSLGQVLDLALNQPDKYAEELDESHTTITAFGGAFLLMLALQFLMADRSIKWLQSIERPLSKYGTWWLPIPVTVAILAGLAALPFNHHPGDTLKAGLAGVAIYLAVTGFTYAASRLLGGDKMEAESKSSKVVQKTGLAAFASFLYLEILDASFSFDGVIGAFAITQEIIIIMIGLGVGAIWVRSLTIYMVRHEVLDAYKYLEHGAHYAVFALAMAMLFGILVEVPEVVTGLAGIGVIIASIIASRQAMAGSKSSSKA